MSPTSTSLSSRELRAGNVLRVLQLLVLAVLAVIVMGHTSPDETSTSLAVDAAIDATGYAAMVRSGSHALSDGSTNDDTSLDALEADIDDDDVDGDHRFASIPWHAIPVPDAPPPATQRSTRLEPQGDPSWFAIGHGFARGPPVSIVSG